MEYFPTLVPNQAYHIYNRGINRQKIFFEKRNYPYFLRLIHRHISKVADVMAYCLLGNHFHLLVRTKDWDDMPNEIQVGKLALHHPFSNCFNAYAKSINKAYNRTGKLMEDRFKRKPVLDEEYLIKLIFYIHANPQHHGLLDDFRIYPHSSYCEMLSDLPTWIDKETVVSFFGNMNDFLHYHSEYHNYLKEMDEEF